MDVFDSRGVLSLAGRPLDVTGPKSGHPYGSTQQERLLVWMFLFAFLMVGVGLLAAAFVSWAQAKEWSPLDTQMSIIGLICVLVPAGVFAIVAGSHGQREQRCPRPAAIHQ